MLKTFWNWLSWQFYKGNADKLLAESTAIVGRMDAKQKLDYAYNASKLGADLWANRLTTIPSPIRHLISVTLFLKHGDKLAINEIDYRASKFKVIMKSDALPEIKELAYAFWSLQRMLAIAYPNHGFKRDSEVGCSDSEALTRIATSIVASVAAAYGHERGCKAYVSVYNAMIDYGKGLVDG